MEEGNAASSFETVGGVVSLHNSRGNKQFWIDSVISSSVKPDQSVAHNGVCLTVEAVEGNAHRVTAIEETLQKTNLNTWKPGEKINIERCLTLGSRLDGHIVQGHVDTTAVCMGKKALNGSLEFRFRFPEKSAPPDHRKRLRLCKRD